MNKHVNPAKHLHEVYTKQGGVQEYNKNQQAVGMLKLAGAILIATKLLLLLDKVENRQSRHSKKGGNTYADTMPRVRTASEPIRQMPVLIADTL